MPISLARAQAHTNEWVERLPSRPGWPKYLFFAAHVTSAAKIIRERRLRCRRDLDVDHDIANQEALGTNPAAFGFVRLYFRPRTPFHLRTEGIKLLTDHYRLPKHMSMPIMFMFSLNRVLSLPNVAFCDRKMAHVGIVPGHDENYFNAIPFDKVYHDSGIQNPAQRLEIHDRRMAEVLIPDQLLLDGNLSLIVCRTIFDGHSLSHLLRDLNPLWQSNLRVATRPAQSTFFCRGTYITDLQFSSGVLTLKIKASHDYITGQEIRVAVKQLAGSNVVKQWVHHVTLSNNSLMITGWQTDQPYDWRIEIEDALAYCGGIESTPATVATR